MKVRIASRGWETYTGSMGFRALFENGVSVGDLDARQIARIGSSLTLVNDETGEQVGPSVMHLSVQPQSCVVVPELENAAQTEAAEAVTRESLVAEATARKAAAAHKKAAAQVDELVVYSRAELEAIGANDGINGLREIGNPLGVKARAINELVDEILKAQTAQTVA